MPVDKVDSVSGGLVSEPTEPNPSTEPAPDQFTLPDGTIVGRDELTRGYMRQQDYTRKTQGLSQERQRVEAANQLLNMLETDPQGTLSQLAQYYGMGGNAPSDDDFEPEGQDDPRYAQLDQRLSQQEALAEQQLQRQADEYLTQRMDKVSQLAEQFGVEVDEDELFQHAFNTQEVDPVKAFYSLYEDELPQMAQQRAIQDYSARRGMPVSRQGLNVPPGPQNRPRAKSIREALRYTMEDVGVDNLENIPIE